MIMQTLGLLNNRDLVIELERFYLKMLKEEDISSDYLSWFDDDKVKAYISFASKPLTKLDLVNYVNIKNSSKTALLLGIFTKSKSKHIGNIKYEPIELLNKTAEMGILVGNVNWRGKGVGPEVILGSAKWLRDSLGLNHITLGVASDNLAAISSYKKIGFVKDPATQNTINSKVIRMYLSLSKSI